MGNNPCNRLHAYELKQRTQVDQIAMRESVGQALIAHWKYRPVEWLSFIHFRKLVQCFFGQLCQDVLDCGDSSSFATVVGYAYSWTVWEQVHLEVVPLWVKYLH